MPDTQQTLVLIKPDALKNSLTGYVLSQLSEFHTGLRFAAMKVVHVSEMLASEHYSEHVGKVFYASLLDYIAGRLHYPGNPEKQRVIAIVYGGKGAVDSVRQLVGPTNPHVARETKPGCIRSLGAVVPLYNEKKEVIGDRMDNLIHASANLGDAEREVKLWFRPSDIPPGMRIYKTTNSDGHYYYKSGKLLTAYESGSFAIMTPGEIVWASDLDIIHAIKGGKALPTGSTLETVSAKYIINDDRMSG